MTEQAKFIGAETAPGPGSLWADLDLRIGHPGWSCLVPPNSLLPSPADTKARNLKRGQP